MKTKLSRPSQPISLATGIFLVTLVNAPAQPTVIQFTSSHYSISETGRTAILTVERAGETNDVVDVEWITADGTAIANLDYETGFDVLQFAPGETWKEIVITLVDDDLVEAEETVVVELHDRFLKVVGPRNCAELTIRDDEVAPALTRWRRSATVSNAHLTDVAYGIGRIVAVGAGAIQTAPNCVDWNTNWTLHMESKACRNSFFPNQIAFGNAMFVAMEHPPFDCRLCACVRLVGVSTNGTDWIVQEGPGSSSIAFGNGLFVAGGYTDIWTSRNGMDWTMQTNSWVDGSSGNGIQIAFGNGIFVAVACDAGRGRTIWVSHDGTDWNQVDAGITACLLGIAYGKETFVAVGAEGTILTSYDGLTWTQRHQGGATDPLYQVSYGGEFFLASASPISADFVLVSLDGVAWTRLRILGPYPIRLFDGPDCGHGTLLALGPDGVVQSDPVVSLAVRWTDCAEIMLTGPMGRTCRVEYASFPETNYWTTLATLNLSSTQFTWKDFE